MLDKILDHPILIIVTAVTGFFSLVLGFCFWYLNVDGSELVHQSFTAQLVDKWHEESCSPIIMGTQYYGESCDDEYTIVLLVDGQRITQKVSHPKFEELKVGGNVRWEYDLGKLGGHHHEVLEMIQ